MFLFEQPRNKEGSDSTNEKNGIFSFLLVSGLVV